MSKQFTTCPQCGAMGEIGANCEFCGAHIEAKDNSTVCNELIPQHRTISSAEFAKKVSIFHNVDNFISVVAQVRIGNLKGVINLNGDLVLPIEYSDIIIESDSKYVEANRRYILIRVRKEEIGKYNSYLIKVNGDGDLLHAPQDMGVLTPKDYSLLPDYNNSVLFRHYAEFIYYNLITKTSVRFNILIAKGLYCYVGRKTADRNKETLAEVGIYETKSWSLIRKLDGLEHFHAMLEEKYDGVSLESFLSLYNEFFAEEEKRKKEEEEEKRKKEAREKLEGNIFYRIFAGIGRAIWLVFRIIFDLIGL